jgi:hypothetical protein
LLLVYLNPPLYRGDLPYRTAHVLFYSLFKYTCKLLTSKNDYKNGIYIVDEIHCHIVVDTHICISICDVYQES